MTHGDLLHSLADYCRRSGTSAASSVSGGRRSASPATTASTVPLNDEEDPITQSTYPAAQRPQQNHMSAIERDDWPGPQFTGLVLAEMMREKRRSRGEDSLDSASSWDSRMESEIASICHSEQSGMCQVSS